MQHKEKRQLEKAGESSQEKRRTGTMRACMERMLIVKILVHGDASWAENGGRRRKRAGKRSRVPSKNAGGKATKLHRNSDGIPP